MMSSLLLYLVIFRQPSIQIKGLPSKKKLGRTHITELHPGFRGFFKSKFRSAVMKSANEFKIIKKVIGCIKFTLVFVFGTQLCPLRLSLNPSMDRRSLLYSQGKQMIIFCIKFGGRLD